MNSDLQISVVIPAYNVERYLPMAIESVLRQTCKPLEVIVVNDGSQDGTREIAEAFGGPVRCISQPNAGLPGARNTGVRNARGALVALLDADDEWLDIHLENAVRVLSAHPFLRWYCSAYERFVDGSGKAGEMMGDNSFPEGGYYEDFFTAQMRYQIASASSIVIARQVFEKIGLFDTSLRRAEDLDMWFRIALQFPPIGYHSRVSARYRLRPDSLSNQPRIGSREFFDRVVKTEQAAIRLGPQIAARGEPMLRHWIEQLTWDALYKDDRAVLKDVLQRYGQRMPSGLRTKVRFFSLIPHPVVRACIGMKAMLRSALGR